MLLGDLSYSNYDGESSATVKSKNESDTNLRDNKDFSKNIIPMWTVSVHNKIDDCWTVIDGYVYDITPILKHHPGGFSQIF